MSVACRRELWDCATLPVNTARCQPPIVQNLRRLGYWGWVSVLDRRTLRLLKRGFLVSRGVNKPQSRVETRSQRRDAGVPTGGELYIPVRMCWPLVFAQRVRVGARCRLSPEADGGGPAGDSVQGEARCTRKRRREQRARGRHSRLGGADWLVVTGNWWLLRRPNPRDKSHQNLQSVACR